MSNKKDSKLYTSFNEYEDHIDSIINQYKTQLQSIKKTRKEITNENDFEKVDNKTEVLDNVVKSEKLTPLTPLKVMIPILPINEVNIKPKVNSDISKESNNESLYQDFKDKEENKDNLISKDNKSNSQNKKNLNENTFNNQCSNNPLINPITDITHKESQTLEANRYTHLSRENAKLYDFKHIKVESHQNENNKTKSNQDYLNDLNFTYENNKITPLMKHHSISPNKTETGVDNLIKNVVTFRSSGQDCIDTKIDNSYQANKNKELISNDYLKLQKSKNTHSSYLANLNITNNTNLKELSKSDYIVGGSVIQPKENTYHEKEEGLLKFKISTLERENEELKNNLKLSSEELYNLQYKILDLENNLSKSKNELLELKNKNEHNELESLNIKFKDMESFYDNIINENENKINILEQTNKEIKTETEFKDEIIEKFIKFVNKYSEYIKDEEESLQSRNIEEVTDKIDKFFEKLINDLFILKQQFENEKSSNDKDRGKYNKVENKRNVKLIDKSTITTNEGDEGLIIKQNEKINDLKIENNILKNQIDRLLEKASQKKDKDKSSKKVKKSKTIESSEVKIKIKKSNKSKTDCEIESKKPGTATQYETIQLNNHYIRNAVSPTSNQTNTSYTLNSEVIKKSDLHSTYEIDNHNRDKRKAQNINNSISLNNKG